MLKPYFWILLLANVVLFLFQSGSSSSGPNAREPERVNNQLNADKIELNSRPASDRGALSPGTSTTSIGGSEATASAAGTPSAAAQPAASCVEVGNFSPEDSRRFSERLVATALRQKALQRTVQGAVSYMVYIPTHPTREAAEATTAELRRRGVDNFYIMPDSAGDMRRAISLGVYKSEEMARMQLAKLYARGVRDAQINERASPSSLVAFQLQDVDAVTQSLLDRIKADFPSQEFRRCKAA